MRQIINYLVVIVFLFCGIQSVKGQKIYEIEDVPNLFLLEDQSIYDPEHVLSEKEFQNIDLQLQVLKDSLDIKASVVLLPEIKETTLTSDFSKDLYKELSLAGNMDKCFLIVVLYGNDRQLRLSRQSLDQQGSKEINASSMRIQKTESYIIVDESLKQLFPDIIRWRIMREIDDQSTWGKGVIKGLDILIRLFSDEEERLNYIKLLEEDEEESLIIGSIVLGVPAVIFLFMLLWKLYKKFIKK